MDKYNITIEAKCYFSICIEAKNIEQAKKIAMKAYHDADHGELYRIKSKIIVAEPLRLVKEEKKYG